MKLIELKLIGNELWEKHNFEIINDMNYNDLQIKIIKLPVWEKVPHEELGKSFIANEIED